MVLWSRHPERAQHARRWKNHREGGRRHDLSGCTKVGSMKDTFCVSTVNGWLTSISSGGKVLPGRENPL